MPGTKQYSIGKGMTLRTHIEACLNDKQASNWMITAVDDYSLDMQIYPVFLENWDLDPDEYSMIEDQVLSSGNGYANFLNSDQLLDIIENLTAQNPQYTDQELESAINFYSMHDTFIDLNLKSR
ncbi:MAG: hypothetical protein VYA55_07760 [Pseudomonadota bacterium]|nr:hypothetical protein [Pseudomonadota bacterium]